MIKAIITDFDGTLVDTFEANLRAYQEAFHKVGLSISSEQYKCFYGLRFDSLMNVMGVEDVRIKKIIKDAKHDIYPTFFDLIIPNYTLIDFLKKVKYSGIMVSLASTARRDNLNMVLKYLSLDELFDLIIAGDDVIKGKPDPEIYIQTMKQLNVSPEETLIFEDSDVGVSAASVCKANFIKISEHFFNC